MLEKIYRKGRVCVRLQNAGSSDCCYIIKPTNFNSEDAITLIHLRGFWRTADILFSLFGILNGAHSPLLMLKDRIELAMDKAERAYLYHESKKGMAEQQEDESIFDELG